MGKNIILHGATNFCSSNYGDFLYGEMIFNYLKNRGDNVQFYQPSKFFIDNIPDYIQMKPIKKRKVDLVIYLPGGYLGGGDKKSRLRDIIIRFYRFFPLGIWTVIAKKKLVIIAIGADPLGNRLLQYGTKIICNHAIFTTVRDNKTYTILKNLCKKANIFECGDLILTSKLEENYSPQLNRIIENCGQKKLLLVHYNHDKEALTKFAISVNKFLQKNPMYEIVVASDSVLEYEEQFFDIFKEKLGIKCWHFIYSKPSELTALIKMIDMVLTCKLHVGVVACSFNKSVIVAACHYDKTVRFYEQISEKNRCVDLHKISPDELQSLLENYKDKTINIDNKIIEKAKESWNILERYMIELNEKK